MAARARVAANDDGRVILASAHALPRRGLRREEAALYVGVSPSKFDAMVEAGDMPKPKKFGGCSVWDIRALDLAFDGVGGNDGGPNPWD